MIKEFRGRYRFLSNFWPCSITMDGDLYVSVEHAFQAAKTLDQEQRTQIRNAPTPGKAKRLGRVATLRDNWEKEKFAVMEDLVFQKFNYNDQLNARLLATENQNIVEGNNWGDGIWGVCKGEGENHLGRILMKVRSGFQETEE